MATVAENSQIELWRGAFGDDYIGRNAVDDQTLRALTRTWSRMLECAHPFPESILEVGANIGLNLRALRRITNAKLHAAEPNETARARLIEDSVVAAGDVTNAVAGHLPFAGGSFDCAFTSGVLIHIHPDQLLASCSEIVRVSSRYVLCAEYFAAQPREIAYRGLEGYLFLRDFGQFYLDNFPTLRLIDYGFFWQGAGAAESINWWLFRKN